MVLSCFLMIYPKFYSTLTFKKKADDENVQLFKSNTTKSNLIYVQVTNVQVGQVQEMSKISTRFGYFQCLTVDLGIRRLNCFTFWCDPYVKHSTLHFHGFHASFSFHFVWRSDCRRWAGFHAWMIDVSYWYNFYSPLEIIFPSFVPPSVRPTIRTSVRNDVS